MLLLPGAHIRESGSVCACLSVCVCVLGLRIGQRWKQKQEQGHNTCALRWAGFIISVSARDPCNSAWGGGGGVDGEGCLLSIFRVGNKPPEKSIGRQTEQRLPASFARSRSRSRSLGFSLWACFGVDMLQAFFNPLTEKMARWFLFYEYCNQLFSEWASPAQFAWHRLMASSSPPPPAYTFVRLNKAHALLALLFTFLPLRLHFECCRALSAASSWKHTCFQAANDTWAPVLGTSFRCYAVLASAATPPHEDARLAGAHSTWTWRRWCSCHNISSPAACVSWLLCQKCALFLSYSPFTTCQCFSWLVFCPTVCPSARPCVRLSASSCEQKACFGFYDLPLLQPVEMSSQ